jgi:hypothetical protein
MTKTMGSGVISSLIEESTIGMVTMPGITTFLMKNTVRYTGEMVIPLNPLQLSPPGCWLKGQCHEIFYIWFFSSNNPI